MSLESIRLMSVDDLDAVWAIQKSCNPAPWTREQWQEELEQELSQILVVTDDETDEQIYAYLVVRVLASIDIVDIAVRPDFRGLGFAKRLLQFAIRLGIQRQLQEIWLEVRANNASAVQLYQKTGFTIRSKYPRYYSNGDDAYRMALDLEGDVRLRLDENNNDNEGLEQ